MVAAALYVDGINTVYPNVSIGSCDVGGMTLQQAASALAQSGLNSYDENAVVTVSFSTGDTLTVSAQDAAATEPSVDAAITAYEFGREGNLFLGLINYIKCSFTENTVPYESAFHLDTEGVRAMISKAAETVNSNIAGNELVIAEDSITVTKGISAILVDVDEVYSLIEAAFRSGTYGTVAYEPTFHSDEELDLESLHSSVFAEMKNAEYDPLTYQATQSVTGVTFDMDSARQLWDAALPGEKVSIPLTRTEPEVTTEELNALLFADVLAEKLTYLTYDANRNNNVTRACQSINELILNPGEEFSYNLALGQRTLASGYLGAGAYSNGEVVTEVGGGICQVSSALYYCTLLSNLKITDRTCHYFPVSYVPAGLDATVSWRNPDFKFVNNREYPIKIIASTNLENYTVTVRILGTDVDGSYVKMETASWETDYGWGAISYRVVYNADGTVASRTKEADSKYHKHEEPSPSPSESVEPSESPVPTESAAPSDAPVPTGSAAPSDTPAPTESAVPSDTPAPTGSAAPTDSASPTVSPDTPAATDTPVVTTPPAETPEPGSAVPEPTTPVGE